MPIMAMDKDKFEDDDIAYDGDYRWATLTEETSAGCAAAKAALLASLGAKTTKTAVLYRGADCSSDSLTLTADAKKLSAHVSRPPARPPGPGP
eukprot:tig00000133_g7670.t1